MSASLQDRIRLLVVTCVLCVLPCIAAAQARVSNLDLMPGSIQAVLDVVDVPRMEDRWERTALGGLTSEPELKPFWDAQQESIRNRLSKSGLAVNITLDDLRQIASRGASIGWAQLQGSTGVCLVVETKGREIQTADVLKRIDKELRTKRQATVRNETYRGEQISVYTLKRKIGQINVEKFSYVQCSERLIASDQFELVKSVIDAIDDESSRGALIQQNDFKTVQQKVGDGSQADIQWFVRPLAYARILETRGGGLKKQQLDTIKLLQDQGFDAIIAAGGHLTLDEEKFDINHRAFILAPPTTNLASRYRDAARMLQFPNEAEREPPSWVLPTVASYLDGNWKMEEAFWAAETLVNQAVGDEIFRRVVDGIKKDKDGPQIDIANDIIANLKNRLILLTDNVLPVTKQSERMLIAVSIKNAEKVKAAVDKAMKSDPNAIEYDYSHHRWIWQVTQPDLEDDLDLEGFEDFEEFDDFGDEDAEESPPLLDQWAITVYDGYLMFSSHAQMLVDTIEHHRKVEENDALTEQPDFNRVREAFKQQQGASRAIWRVLRTNLAFRIKYGLFKRGELRDSDSVLAAIIRRALEDSEEFEDPEKLSIDGSKLPAFSVIEKYLQPSGVLFKTTEDGWLMNGLLLRPADR